MVLGFWDLRLGSCALGFGVEGHCLGCWLRLPAICWQALLSSSSRPKLIILGGFSVVSAGSFERGLQRRWAKRLLRASSSEEESKATYQYSTHTRSMHTYHISCIRSDALNCQTSLSSTRQEGSNDKLKCHTKLCGRPCSRQPTQNP